MHPSPKGIRTIAIVEAVKGVLVLFAGLGAFALLNHNVQAVAETLVRHSRVNPASHYPRVFVEAAGKLHDPELRLLAAGALAYSLVRFVEAYGLWRQRLWAEWFAAASGAIYLPLEVYELFREVTWLKLAVFVINCGVVFYLVWVLSSRRGKALTNDSGK